MYNRFNVTVSEQNIGDSDYYVNLDFNDNSNLSIVTNLADGNHNASIYGPSLASWENGVIRITTKGGAGNQGLKIIDLDTVINEMSIEMVFQNMDETKTNSVMSKVAGLGNETIIGQLASNGFKFVINAYNDGNKGYVATFDHTCNMTEKNHMLLSLKSGELVLYVNGLEVKRTNNTYTNLSMKLVQLAEYNFDGNIELFKIYKKALSSTEVTTAYNDYLNK